MNDLSTGRMQLPDTIEDLAEFVLVNEERIQALRASIRAIQKVSLAREVYEQKLAEAQEIGEITVEAAQRMGELLLQIQKQTGNQYTSAFSRDDEKAKTKTEITSEMGMTKDQVSQYQQMAQNPEAVQVAIQKAIDNGDVVSRSQVMKEIRAVKEEAKRQIEELKNRKPEVKEVVPEDYEDTKRQLRVAESISKRVSEDYNKVRKANQAQQKRIKELEAQIGSDKKLRDANLTINYFTSATNDYIQRYGGSVWAFAEIENVDDATKEGFIKAIKSLDAFAQQLISNLEGGNLV